MLSNHKGQEGTQKPREKEKFSWFDRFQNRYNQSASRKNKQVLNGALGRID
jgi:exonuclease III